MTKKSLVLLLGFLLLTLPLANVFAANHDSIQQLQEIIRQLRDLAGTNPQLRQLLDQLDDLEREIIAHREIGPAAVLILQRLQYLIRQIIGVLRGLPADVAALQKAQQLLAKLAQLSVRLARPVVGLGTRILGGGIGGVVGLVGSCAYLADRYYWAANKIESLCQVLFQCRFINNSTPGGQRPCKEGPILKRIVVAQRLAERFRNSFNLACIGTLPEVPSCND